MGEATRRKKLGLYPEKTWHRHRPLLCTSSRNTVVQQAGSSITAVLSMMPSEAKAWFDQPDIMRRLASKALSEAEVKEAFDGFQWERFGLACLYYDVKGEVMLSTLATLIVATLPEAEMTNESTANVANNCVKFLRQTVENVERESPGLISKLK